MNSGATLHAALHSQRGVDFLVVIATTLCSGCGSTDEEPRVPRPFVMVEGEEVHHTPLAMLNVTRRGEGLIVAPSSVLSTPKLTCTQLPMGSCFVETCTRESGSNDYGIASVEMKSGPNTYSSSSTETTVEPADFWEPGAPIMLRLSASESPAKAPFADTELRGPPPLQLSSPTLAPSRNGPPGAKALELRVDREFVASWSPVAAAMVFVSLTCTNESMGTTWWAQVRCEVDSDAGEVRVPTELIDYLPGPHCNFTLVTRAAATVIAPGQFFEFDVRRIAQTAEGVDADGGLVLR